MFIAAAQLRLTFARVPVSGGLAWALTLPAMLPLAGSQPEAARALLFAYAGIQRAAVVNIVDAPTNTLRWHLLALP